ncbi:ribosome hibernation-promoting factor, HPF/YfiA family [Marinigracilibium pacificum]|uniref:Ribosome-associated translation inhibitor RaiA n=1 Tax=Marinigracilibium pacificum TaxID=2729599 RepID=A0A848J2S4_9BACT|nr:ribosome-associated translation inhibitor RaiA [Marinigracilibium pacificum]NMM49805.1 ribosome-associated translation inhibitor RaiA [Marinigracilibium pacificum]
MKLQMHSIHFDADQKLLDFVQSKADKLETFYDRITDGEVFFRLEKNDQRENKIVEIMLNIPGNQLFASEQSKSFEAAADKAVEALRRQIKKYKEKQLGR